MRKIAAVLSIVILLVPLGSIVSFAVSSVAIDSFIESVEEINETQEEEGRTLEDSAGSRVIVKANKPPEIFGNSDCIKGTYGKYVFQYATEEEAEEAAAYYSSLAGVSYAVIDRIVQAQGISYSEAMLGTQRAKEYIANQAIPTSSVKVAVIDTGIEFSHYLFKDNLRIIDSGVNTTDSGIADSAMDDQGHGSLCSEIVMDNTGDDVTIIGYKALNCNGAGTNLWVATAIEKAIEDEVDIINLSLGGEAEPAGYESSIVLDDAVRLAMSKEILVVAAAGNEGLDCVHFSPANIEGVITVGAIDKAGNHAYFSDYGESVDFVAPGVEIEHDYVRQYYAEDGTLLTDFEDPVNGTSFSCPYVVAEIATLFTVFQPLSRDETVEKLSNASIPYEHLTYHDGFHAITENKGVRYQLTPRRWYEWCIDANSEDLYYGKGMPQVDLAVEFCDNLERENTPSFTVESGHYVDKEYDLEMIAASGADIYYTQDESYPTKENGTKYDGSIHLDELQSFRAVAFSESKAPSYFASREFEFEYHTNATDYVMSGKKILQYKGERKNIIVPEKINGVAPSEIYIETHNTSLTSITLPDSCQRFYSKPFNGKYCTTNLIKIVGNGLSKLTVDKENRYPNLVLLEADQLQYLDSNCDFYELNLPNVNELYLKNSQCLYTFSAESLVKVPARAFYNCYSLHDLYLPQLKSINEYGFLNCYKLTNVNFENVEHIATGGLGSTRQLKNLYMPSLISSTSACFNGCGVTFFFAPKLKTLSEMFGCYNNGYYQKFVFSSAFTEFGEDAEGYKVEDGSFPPKEFWYHYLIDLYGTPGTYVEEYANRFNLKFVALPLLESEPEDMGHQSDGEIIADVLGFNREYQWYGTNIKDNRLGIALDGENGETIDTSKYDYSYYYCVVKTHDGDYKKDIVTGTRKTLDMNGDGIIDIADLSILLHYYGEVPEEDIYDVNEDGIIDIQDIQYLLFSTVYGTKE